ncbi:MAG TPA: endolytic transglycosylase MltG [Gemmatimonadaceae bacterium]|nr:endolytic transglycosylase MltG [Gemmatimonadaceae bacterium]
MPCSSPADRRRGAPRRAAAPAAAAAALCCLTTLAACGGGGGSGAPIRVVIPPGSSMRAAAESLDRAGVVRSARLFRAYAGARGRDRTLKPGTYEFRRGASYADLLSAMTGGKAVVHTITIPEGYALVQIVPLLARTIEAPPESVAAAVGDTVLRRRLDVPTPTLEGYLFPATYKFSVGTTPRAAVEEMVREFEKRWKPAWNDRLQAMAISRHDIVTLASIVEKEARRPEERSVIAAVYYNRLKRGMLLQADPTVQYSLGKHVQRVYYKDLDVESPYNTYKHAGLPPGPIASPGAASIEAALYPANVPYLFFVAHPDGHHEFRTTFEEHRQARQAVERARGAGR